MNKETNNRQQNTTPKTKNCYTNPLKAGGELVCSGNLCSPSTIDTQHDTFYIQSCRSYYATQHLCQRSFYKIFGKFRNSKTNVLKIVLIIVNINKDEKIALHEPHELVCSGSLCSASTIDTHHDTVKRTRTSYDMEFVLNTTKTQINT